MLHNSLAIQQAILKTIIYADIFTCSLKTKEIYQKLQYNQKIAYQTFKHNLEILIKNKKIYCQQDFCILIQRQELIALRKQRIKISLSKQKILERRLKYFKIIPFIKAIFLTGSVATQNCREEDDIDLLIICQKNSLWLCRILVVLWSDLLRIRRKPKDKIFTNKLCFNIFLEESSLTLAKNQQNIFSANELIQAKALLDKDQFADKLLQDNIWILDFLAQSFVIKDSPHKIERTSYLLSLINKIAYLLQRSYMRSKITQETIKYDQAFFHKQNLSIIIQKEFNTRKKAFGLI
ncbi:nucleotidyltransferase domain-containing protein [Candidatus Beckwithbacteria bacterium]|nr:nucleotidyltransferase domain-containing protein [Candidatus Beckwithbacteria bacterium]